MQLQHFILDTRSNGVNTSGLLSTYCCFNCFCWRTFEQHAASSKKGLPHPEVMTGLGVVKSTLGRRLLVNGQWMHKKVHQDACQRAKRIRWKEKDCVSSRSILRKTYNFQLESSKLWKYIFFLDWTVEPAAFYIIALLLFLPWLPYIWML